jgi:coenzyme F420-reducing hydrogenase delta subunit
MTEQLQQALVQAAEFIGSIESRFAAQAERIAALEARAAEIEATTIKLEEFDEKVKSL